MTRQGLINKHIVYSIVLLILFVFQTCGNNLKFNSIFEPDLIFAFVIAAAMWEGELFGLVYGLAGGILCDILGSRPGYFALIYMLLGYAVALIIKFLVVNSIKSYLIICISGFVLVSFMTFFFMHFIWGQGGFLELIINVIFKRGLATLLTGVGIYYLLGKLSEKLSYRGGTDEF